MNLYDKASLILTPNAYKASKLYALKPTDGSGDLSVTRASTKFRRNESGILQSLAINVPALEHPAVGCPAIMLDVQRTNLYAPSEGMTGGAWIAPINVSVSDNQGTAPDGANTAGAMKETVDNGSHFYFGDSTVVNGTTYTVSLFAKSIGGRNIKITGSGSLSGSVSVSLTDGSILAGTGKVVSYPNGWYRISLTATATGTIGRWIVYSLNGSSDSFAGDVTKGVLLWGFQHEAGSYASAYIKTTSGSATRVADAMVKTGISSLIGQAAGTLFADINTFSESTSKRISISDGTANNRIYIEATTALNVTAVVGGTPLTPISFGSIVTGTRYKIAFKYSNNSLVMYVNGVSVGSLGSITIPSMSRFGFDGGDGNNPFAGNVNMAALYQTDLTNAELAALTT